MIELYKMFSDCDYLDVDSFFTLEEGNRTRGHDRKIRKQGCKLDLRKYFFSHRVVDLWNALPGGVVFSSSLNVFKKRLEKFMDEKIW